jgi:3-hydroxybutyryl-CoA dehydrogenase
VVIGSVGVVGAGTMGAGIAQLAVEAGHQVLLHDVDAAAIDRGLARIRTGLERRAARLDLDPESTDAWVQGRLELLESAPALEDVVEAEPILIVEAALEDLPLKREIFRSLDALAPAATILATNTSALSVAAIATATAHPGRVVGLHFFNPAPIMPLVEVVAAPRTDPEIVNRATAIVTAWGKSPVRCSDTPGFIVNRVNRPFTLEALSILEAGGASVTSIDDAIRAAGFPMGPFELMDLVGLDVNLAAARGIFEAFRTEAGAAAAERFRPSPIQERMVAAEHLGRKTGVGFYRYEAGGRADGPASEFAAPGEPRRAIEDRDIVDRIVLAIVNEAYRALGDGVATSADIDLAMRLGAGQPVGPFERVGALGGPGGVLAGLRRFASEGPRFDPAPALVREATGLGPRLT